MREKQGQNGADSKEVLNLEGIKVWIMGRFVVIEHEVNDIPGGTNEEDLECGEIY